MYNSWRAGVQVVHAPADVQCHIEPDGSGDGCTTRLVSWSATMKDFEEAATREKLCYEDELVGFDDIAEELDNIRMRETRDDGYLILELLDDLGRRGL